MFTIEDYIKQTIMFTNSLVIKSTCSALAINKRLLTGGLGPSSSNSKHTWKYYLNLAGKKHITNSDVKCYVTELSRYESLTPELLDRYESTKRLLLKNEDEYKRLLEDFPNDTLYIHGCLYPVDINTAIQAKDGTILNYNPNYIQDNEYSLIKELNIYTTNFFKRWFIKEYTLIDELYMATVLANLYASIPSKIMNIRLSKVLTSEVHDFYMEHFFRSNLDIWEDVKYLKSSTKLWMYKNLNYLKKNVGKNISLTKLIDKLMTESSVGVGSYKIRTKDIQKAKGRSAESLYEREPNELAATKLNSYFELDNNKTYDVTSMLNTEITNLKSKQDRLYKTNARDAYIVDNALKDINSSYKDNQQTKILEVTGDDIFKNNSLNLVDTVLSYLMYMIKYSKISYMLEFIDPNNSKIYNITVKEALILAIKYLMDIAETPDTHITSLRYTNILLSSKDDVKALVEKCTDDELTLTMFNNLLNIYPVFNNVTSVEEMRDLVLDVDNFFTMSWLGDSNSSSTLVSSNLKQFLNMAVITGEYIPVEGGFNPTKWLNANGIVIEDISTYSSTSAFNALLKSICGLDFVSIGSNIENYFNILNKLTSYTLQVILNKKENNKIQLFYNNIDVYRSNVGIIHINDGILVPYDLTHIYIKSYANAFVDAMDVSIIEDTDYFIAVSDNKPIKGYMLIVTSYVDMSNPFLSIEVQDLPVIDVSELDNTDRFLLDGKGSMVPYVPVTTRVHGKYDNFYDIPVDAVATENEDTTDRSIYIDHKPNIVDGYGLFISSMSASDATLIIEIEDVI